MAKRSNLALRQRHVCAALIFQTWQLNGKAALLPYIGDGLGGDDTSTLVVDAESPPVA